MEKIILYNPAISSMNIGDEIIVNACKKYLLEIFPNNMYIDISTHLPINNSYLNRIKSVKASFVLGSNLLMPKMDARFRQWDIKIWNVNNIKPAILMGVGWHHYSNKTTLYTKILYNKILSNKYYHSVRDEYTKLKLQEIGIKNVINTGCPSFWNFTKKHCENIPKNKGEKVVFTLTDYKKDYDKDKKMIKILEKNYKKIYFWIQGSDDYEYLKKIQVNTKIEIIKPNLIDYENILKNDIDYVGTRLHGGIKALEYKRRSIIIAVDNRAKELNKNYNIPVVNRENIDMLDSVINNYFITNIKIPIENINKWKNQFII